MRLLLIAVLTCIILHNNQATLLNVTDQVFLDIMIDDYPIGTIVIGLFGDAAPKTVKNFLTIATKGINGRTYVGSKFHRIVKKFMVQGGDVDKGDGTGSISIYGKYFEVEDSGINQTGPGFVSMANAGKNTNGCQFFITTVATPWLDRNHTVFGKVINGEDVLFKVEQTKTDAEYAPINPVVILKSGFIPTPQAFSISDDPYDVWAWIKATAVPLSFSFTILAFFHWMIRQLDANSLTMQLADKLDKQD